MSNQGRPIGENNSIGAALNTYVIVCLGFAVRKRTCAMSCPG